MPGIPEKTDVQWEAESDANTLAIADEILNDDKRLKAAKKAANNMAKETADHLAGLLRVAGKLGESVESMKVIGKAD